MVGQFHLPGVVRQSGGFRWSDGKEHLFRIARNDSHRTVAHSYSRKVWSGSIVGIVFVFRAGSRLYPRLRLPLRRLTESSRGEPPMSPVP